MAWMAVLRCAALCVLIYALIFALMSVHASRILHSRMLANILRAPMMFFDTTPIGRILNRFSRDMETVDGVLPFTTRSWLSTFFNVLATVVVIVYSTPLFASVVIPLLVIYYLIQVTACVSPVLAAESRHHDASHCIEYQQLLMVSANFHFCVYSVGLLLLLILTTLYSLCCSL